MDPQQTAGLPFSIKCVTKSLTAVPATDMRITALHVQ